MSAQTTIPETVQAGPGLLIHSPGPLEHALAGILRSAANARAALGQEADIEVVVQGPGVTLLATNSLVTEAITNAGQLQVDILACGNSMRSAGMEDKDPPPASEPCPQPSPTSPGANGTAGPTPGCSAAL